MPKIHYFQRYSSVENTVTNNTLQLIARIYNYSNSQASKLLTDIIGEPVEIGIEVNQQQRATDSVPDGSIIQRSFKILIESKVGSGVSEDQLLRHVKTFSNEAQRILLLLTVQKMEREQEKHLSDAITKEHGNIIFRNVTYEDICNSLRDLFRDYEYEMRALVDDYVEYCNDTGLFDQSRFFMRIVPCGKSYELNKKYGIYFHPTDRGYTRHSYIGIYAQKKVQCLWCIDSVFDVEYDGSKLAKKLVQGRDTSDYDERIIAMIAEAEEMCGYEVASGHRFFCGKQAIDTDFVKITPGGIQGARFVNVKDYAGRFTDDNDLASKLREKTWE
jgi:hypothetical protein